MTTNDALASIGAPGQGQGILELTIAIVLGIAFVAFLVVGIVQARRGSGKPRIWFGLSAAVFVVWALSLALV